MQQRMPVSHPPAFPCSLRPKHFVVWILFGGLNGSPQSVQVVRGGCGSLDLGFRPPVLALLGR